MIDKLASLVAKNLPKKVAYWCLVHAGAKVARRMGKISVLDITIVDILKVWRIEELEGHRG